MEIKETPTIYGQDTINFMIEMETSKPVSVKDKEKILKDYYCLESIKNECIKFI